MHIYFVLLGICMAVDESFKGQNLVELALVKSPVCTLLAITSSLGVVDGW